MMQPARSDSASREWWNACARGVGHLARTALMCALFLAPAWAADKASARGEPAILPGHEEEIAAMLGKAQVLPDGCTLTAGGVDHNVINATYTCPSGDVVFELAHPDSAAATATQTANFAITLRSGTPPDSLTDALASLIRSREADFEWTWPGAVNEDATDDDGDDAD